MWKRALIYGGAIAIASVALTAVLDAANQEGNQALGWIGLRLDRPGVDWTQVDDWLQRSWQACAPKRLTRLMSVADEF